MPRSLEAVDEALRAWSSSRSGRSKPKSPRRRIASADAQVEVVLVRQHEVEGAGRRVAHLGLDRVDADACGCAPGHGGRASVASGNSSSRSSIQSTTTSSVREHARDRAADVAGAVQLQVKAAARSRGQRVQRRRVERREAQRHRAAAALAERRAEREVLALRRGVAAREHRRAPARSPSARGGRRRSCRALPSAPTSMRVPALARHRAARLDHLDDHRRPRLGEPARRARSRSSGSLMARSRLHRGDRAQDRLARRRRRQRRVDAVPADRRHRVADREEHRERQQQRRLADRLAAVDACRRRSSALEQRTLKTGGQSLAVGIL